MDVQCPACKTEYEFDDALVSERGTTVRCTTCAHQFKLKRVDSVAAPPPPDRWHVRTSDGQELVFTSLRDLQRAIMSRQVQRGDLLTRGEAPRRQLGSIAELEPFFEGKRTSRPPPPPGPSEGSGARLPPPPPPMRSRMGSIPPQNQGDAIPRGTQLGIGIPSMTTNTSGSVVVELAAMRRPAPSAPPSPMPSSGAGAGPTRSASGTLRPPSNRSAAVPPPADDEEAISSSAFLHEPPPSEAALTIRRPTDPPPFASARATRDYTDVGTPVVPVHRPPTPTRPPPTHSASQPPLPPPTIRVDVPSIPPSNGGYDPARGPSYSMPPADGVGLYSVAPPRRRKGGWVLATALLAGVGAIGFLIARPYLAPAPPPSILGATLDPRAQQFLRDGDRALSDGNLEGAKENFDKASALAEKDPHVTAAVARFATARADIPWLHLRLVAADASDDVKLTKKDLEEQVARARKSADDAVATAPDDGTALRLRVDALRLADEKDAARVLVPKILASSTQPETAYVLAMLDTMDLEPAWPAILDRLRLAAGSEGNAGRARAALVYALARSGDGALAKMELEKLNALPRPHPLASLLRAFVEKAPTAKRVDGGAPSGVVAAAAGAPVVDVSSLPSGPRAMAGGGGGGGGAGGGGGGSPSDPRTALQQGDTALRKGDYERARTMFQSVLAKNPSDSEALAGLGDVSRAQRDSQGAQNYYRQALSANPTYLPALIGLGDVQWDLGDKATAQKTYKDIGERFPESAYPARVKVRADGTPAPPAPAPAATPATTGTVTEDYNGTGQ